MLEILEMMTHRKTLLLPSHWNSRSDRTTNHEVRRLIFFRSTSFTRIARILVYCFIQNAWLFKGTTMAIFPSKLGNRFLGNLEDFAYSHGLVLFCVCLCVCLPVKIVRIGHTLPKIKNVKNDICGFGICYRMVNCKNGTPCPWLTFWR